MKQVAHTSAIASLGVVGAIGVCFASLASDNAQLTIQLTQPHPPLGFFVQRPTYTNAPVVAVFNSPVPSFTVIPVMRVEPVVGYLGVPGASLASGEPGMFTCTRNGMVSRIGAVGCPEGFSGTFVVRAEPYFVPQRPQETSTEVLFMPNSLLPE